MHFAQIRRVRIAICNKNAQTNTNFIDELHFLEYNNIVCIGLYVYKKD